MYPIYSDNLPTVLIKSWPLEADLFDGDLLAGSIPSLYSDHQRPTEEPLGPPEDIEDLLHG